MLGRLFGMQQPHANRWIHLMHPVVNCALERAGYRPERADIVEISAETNDDTLDENIPFLSMMGVNGS